jgi:hypothetical protein
MSWLRIDDGFAQHPKIVQLTPKDRWTWLELLCYCARYRTGGRVPAGIAEVVRGTTPAFLARCERLRLLEAAAGGDFLVHDWQIYNGETIAEKVAAYLWKTPDATANEVHKSIGGKRETVLAEVARLRKTGGSPPGSPPGTSSGTQTGSPRARARTRPVPKEKEPKAVALDVDAPAANGEPRDDEPAYLDNEPGAEEPTAQDLEYLKTITPELRELP